MRCLALRHNLSAYVDGRLDTRLHEQVAGHLASCPECEAHHRILVEGLERLKRAEEPRLPDNLWEKVVARIRESGNEPVGSLPPRTSRILTLGGYAAAAASALVAVWVGLANMQRPDKPISPERFAAQQLRDLDAGLDEAPLSLDPVLEQGAFYRVVTAEVNRQ